MLQMNVGNIIEKTYFPLLLIAPQAAIKESK